MKGKSNHLRSGQSGREMGGYHMTFRINDPGGTEYVDRLVQLKPFKRVEPLQSRIRRMESDTTWTNTEDNVASVDVQWTGIRLSDTEAVKEELKGMLVLLQQQALKRIAKAWIKALCPRKQARYPYKRKQQREGLGVITVVPDWWDINVCEHVEPDHVNKDARTDLCLHILRLRPSNEQLRKWNKDLHVPNETLEVHGWTAFLQEQTHVSSILVGLGKTPESQFRMRFRQKILEKLYYVAGEEERFLRGERDDDIIQIERHDDSVRSLSKGSQAKKRVRNDRDSIAGTTTRRQKKIKRDAADRTHMAVTFEEEKSGIDVGRRRLTETGTAPIQMRARGTTSERRLNRTVKARRQLQAAPNMPMVHPLGIIPDAFPQWRTADLSTSSQGSSPCALTGSFGGSHSEYDDLAGPPQVHGAPSTFHGGRDFILEDLEHQQRMMSVYNVTEVPHPQFAPVLNTPLVSPITKYESGSDVAIWPGEYHIAPAVNRYTERMPAGPVQQHFEFATSGFGVETDLYASGVFPEPRELRSIAPAPPFRRPYNGIQMADHRHAQYHGLPMYHQGYPTPEENDEPTPFAYPGPMLDADIPAAALPASVVRGFTGNSSGVGGGAMT